MAQVVLISDGVEQPVRVHDASAEGVQLVTTADLQAGDRVIIRLPDRSTVVAEVRWSRGERIGLRFDAPLSTWQLQAIIAQPS